MNSKLETQLKIASILMASVFAGGCASTYGNLVGGSNLGAQEYKPAVLRKQRQYLNVDGRFAS
jgi:hypothetical protein